MSSAQAVRLAGRAPCRLLLGALLADHLVRARGSTGCIASLRSPWGGALHDLVVAVATCSGGFNRTEPQFVHKRTPRSSRSTIIPRGVCGLRLQCVYLAHGWRKMLPQMLQVLKRTGESAEVGVFKGDFSTQILKRWTFGGRHYAVDPFLHYSCTTTLGTKDSSLEYDKQCRYDQPAWDRIFNRTRRDLEDRFPQRISMVRDLSVAAAARFAESSLDFVYIDARHDYVGVTEDLRAWWPKLRPGALFAGHDFTSRGVHLALRASLPRLLKTWMPRVYVTSENPPSWFTFK